LGAGAGFGAGAGAPAAVSGVAAGSAFGSGSGSGAGAGTGAGSGATGAVVAGSGTTGAVVPGTVAVTLGFVAFPRFAERLADGAAEVFPVLAEKVAADVRPANVLEATWPSWPSTTGEFAPVPAITGTAMTRAVTTVLTNALRASRPLRWAKPRRLSRAPRRSAPVTRAKNGGPEGTWCTA
jgi:hypothetical protein